MTAVVLSSMDQTMTLVRREVTTPATFLLTALSLLGRHQI